MWATETLLAPQFLVGIKDWSPSVHGGGGILGVICVPFFQAGEGIFWLGGDRTAPWENLGVNIAGLLAIIAWTAFWSVLIFGSLSYFNLLRIDRETEFRGNDLVKHGESAYPGSAWTEEQYTRQGA